MTNEIPLIDLAPLADGLDGAKSLAPALNRALEEVGFLIIVNHGVPRDLIENSFVEAKRFHNQPMAAKRALLMNEHNCSSVIVAPQRELDTYGILTMRDVVYNVVAKGLRVHETRVHEVMTKPLIVAMPQMSIKHVARLMANCKVSRMPVIDGNELVGLVRLRDILTDLHLIDSLK